MKIIKLLNPRPGQLVQCCQCFKLIDAQKALIDLEGKPYKAYYHPQCVNIKWGLVEQIGLYYFWKYEDKDGRTIYNVTQKPEPPTTDGGFYSYGYLLKVKGLLKGPTVNDIFQNLE